MVRSLLAISLASLLAVSCGLPRYRAYLINRYGQTVYVTVMQLGSARPYVSVAAADPSVAQDMGYEELDYSNGSPDGEIILRHPDCSLLATLHFGAGEWTVVIDEAGSPSVSTGAPNIPTRSLAYSQSACAAPPSPTSIP
jgi:hypothetical protein